MTVARKNLWCLAVLLLAGRTAMTQPPQDNLPPAPVPVTQGTDTPVAQPPPAPRGTGLPGPPPSATPLPLSEAGSLHSDQGIPAFENLRNHDGTGWFFSLDLRFLGPHVKDRLVAGVTLPFYGTESVHLGMAELDWAGSPRIEIGYNFAMDYGGVAASYRSLVTEGEDFLAGFDLDGGEGLRHSRLDLNVIDLDYITSQMSVAPHLDSRWRVGARLASVFFDSRAIGFFQEDRTSNSFFGAGPHVALDLMRHFPDLPNLSLYGRVEGATLAGRIDQAFERLRIGLADDIVGGATLLRHTQAVPVLGVECGLGWTRTNPWHWSRITFGYVFEQWWSLGHGDDSRGELTTHGLFLRGEFSF